MRVETKKIRALIALSELCLEKNDNTTSLHFLNELYKVAGKIREAYLNIQLLKNIGGQEPFIREQKKIADEQGRRLQEMIPFFLMNLEKNEKKLAGKIKDIKPKCIIDNFKRFLSESALSLATIEPTDQLHEARKKIKFLQYNFRILPRRIQKELSLDTVYLDHIQEHIGSWHDSLVYLNLLKQLPGIEEKLINIQQEKTNSLAEKVYQEGKEFELKSIQQVRNKKANIPE